MPEQDERGRFIAGNAGGGRPKGARGRLGEAFVEALHADFLEHGVATIARVRQENPTGYVKVLASILPRELRVAEERELSDDELTARIRQLAAVLKGDFGFDLDADDDAALEARPAGGTH